jgi:hypothetical protein
MESIAKERMIFRRASGLDARLPTITSFFTPIIGPRCRLWGFAHYLPAAPTATIASCDAHQDSAPSAVAPTFRTTLPNPRRAKWLMTAEIKSKYPYECQQTW